MPLPKPLNTNIRFFFPYLESLNITQCVCKWYGFFSVLIATIREKFRQTTLDWEWRRVCRSLINLTEWCERWVTCQQLIGDIKHTWKNTIFFRVCCYGFSQDWKSFYNTVVVYTAFPSDRQTASSFFFVFINTISFFSLVACQLRNAAFVFSKTQAFVNLFFE